jgi:subtilase family serine protease
MRASSGLRRGLSLVSGVALSTSVLLSGGSAAIATVASHAVSNDITMKVPAGRPVGHVFGCQTDPTAALVCYSPEQIQKAYGIDKLQGRGVTGAGRTIVIIDAFQNPTMASDLAAFDSTFGLPDPTLNIIAPDGLTPFDPTNADMVGWAGEIALDVQWSHAVAPGAKIDLVLSKSDQDADILSATQYAVDHNLGDVISQSFGENENCVDPTIFKAQHAMFASAVAKGITLFASSGDEGAALPTCDGSSWVQAASSPADDPFVTGVGGTELIAAPACRDATTLNEIPCARPAKPAGTYESETALNEPAGEFTEGNFSTGGGFSDLFKRPDFQDGIHGISRSTRGVPDVAYTGAIGHGVLASCGACAGISTPVFFVFGGTSVGSPQWAGLTALADQLGHHRVGDINPALYALGRLGSALTVHDVKKGNNTVTEFDATDSPVDVAGFNAGPGWDATTGLGTPRADVLVPYLAIASH